MFRHAERGFRGWSPGVRGTGLTPYTRPPALLGDLRVLRKKRRSPVIHLIGTAGHPNYGDELITAAWLRWLARVSPHAEVWLDTPRPGQASVLFEGIHPGLRCVDTLFHACWNAPSRDPAETIAFGARVLADPRLIPREVSGVHDLERVDLVHIIGGGYINSIWPQHLALIGAALAIAQHHGARIAMTGAGLIPLADGSGEPLADALAQFDVVDVRDEASHSAIHSRVPQATMTPDDSLLALGADGKVFGSEGSADTMLCIQSDQVQRPMPEIADYVVRTLRAWGAQDSPITLVECLPPNDTAVMPLLRPHLPGLKLLPFSELWRSGFPARPGQRWISTRFHPHLMAAAAGAQGVAIPVSKDYYETKHVSLIQLGSGWTLAHELTEPVVLPASGVNPYGGRLPALRAAKQEVADQVTDLIWEGRGRR